MGSNIVSFVLAILLHALLAFLLYFQWPSDKKPQAPSVMKASLVTAQSNSNVSKQLAPTIKESAKPKVEPPKPEPKLEKKPEPKKQEPKKEPKKKEPKKETKPKPKEKSAAAKRAEAKRQQLKQKKQTELDQQKKELAEIKRKAAEQLKKEDAKRKKQENAEREKQARLEAKKKAEAAAKKKADAERRRKEAAFSDLINEEQGVIDQGQMDRIKRSMVKRIYGIWPVYKPDQSTPTRAPTFAFTLARNGDVKSVRIVKSSNDAAYDQAVLDTVRNVRNFPEVKGLSPAMYNQFKEVKLKFKLERDNIH